MRPLSLRSHHRLHSLPAALPRPLMRLMLPGMDTKRPNYHLKEKMLAQLYISMLGLPPDSESAKELISWKRPSALSRASAGDFPEKAFAVIESRCPSAESLGPRRVTIADMNALLEEPWTRGPRAEQTCPGHVVDVSGTWRRGRRRRVACAAAPPQTSPLHPGYSRTSRPTYLRREVEKQLDVGGRKAGDAHLVAYGRRPASRSRPRARACVEADSRRAGPA